MNRTGSHLLRCSLLLVACFFLALSAVSGQKVDLAFRSMDGASPTAVDYASIIRFSTSRAAGVAAGGSKAHAPVASTAGNLDQQVFAFGLNLVAPHAVGRGRTKSCAGLEIERSRMPRTRDHRRVDCSIGKRPADTRTCVVHGVEGTVHVEDRNLRLVDIHDGAFAGRELRCSDGLHKLGRDQSPFAVPVASLDRSRRRSVLPAAGLLCGRG